MLLFPDSDRLEHTLRKVFSGTPRDRLKEIQEILNKQEVYSGNDILVVNTIELRKNGFLSEPEILKIEQYLKESNIYNCYLLSYNFIHFFK